MGRFENWWKIALILAGGIGRLIAFYIGVRILLGAIHDPKQNPLLWLVALTLMGVPGAGLLERGFDLIDGLLQFLRLPSEQRPGRGKRSAGSSDDSPER